MNFKKKFDHEDINIYLPDNKTIGTSEFFKNKYNKLPDYICDMLEVKTRIEFEEKSEHEFINMIKEKKKLENEKLIKEFEERENLITPLKNELDELDLSGITVLQPAK